MLFLILLNKDLLFAHRAIVAKVWLDQLKYLHKILKSMKHNATPIANNGIATINLFAIGPCLYPIASAIVSLALLNAVSPDVIGHATTQVLLKLLQLFLKLFQKFY